MINLTEEEVRVVGVLIEKERATPEYYPMTINSITNACNQKSGRDPVVNYSQEEVEEVIESLREKKMVMRQTGGEHRVPKFRQTFTELLKLSDAETGAMAVLMLRGPQTFGEIRNRVGRIYNFESLQQVEETINSLVDREEPVVAKLPRQPGTKEYRYTHLLSGAPEINIQQQASDSSSSPVEIDRITSLENELLQLKTEMEELKELFAKFKQQFE
jgi:uncharacterized protein